MGNRAVITTEDKQIGVYLHWNGGRDSVTAFLTYCKLKGYRCPENDCYGWARLCQVIGNYFGGECSVGIDKYNRLDTDNGDNGVYIIKDWNIIGREYEPDTEQQEWSLLDMLTDINNRMPEKEQIDIDILQEAVEKFIKKPITNKQIRAIHAVIKEIGLTLTEYHNLLKLVYKVPTCKDLSEDQASILIEYLNKLKG